MYTQSINIEHVTQIYSLRSTDGCNIAIKLISDSAATQVHFRFQDWQQKQLENSVSMYFVLYYA